MLVSGGVTRTAEAEGRTDERKRARVALGKKQVSGGSHMGGFVHGIIRVSGPYCDILDESRPLRRAAVQPCHVLPAQPAVLGVAQCCAGGIWRSTCVCSH